MNVNLGNVRKTKKIQNKVTPKNHTLFQIDDPFLELQQILQVYLFLLATPKKKLGIPSSCFSSFTTYLARVIQDLAQGLFLFIVYDFLSKGRNKQTYINIYIYQIEKQNKILTLISWIFCETFQFLENGEICSGVFSSSFSCLRLYHIVLL